MNKDNAHLYLPLVQALAEGKTIQYSDRPFEGEYWMDKWDVNFSWTPDRYRIRPLSFAPIPDGAVLHNPDGLTPEQVGEGWRLLVGSELDRKLHREGEFWNRNEHWKRFQTNGDKGAYFSPLDTIRVPLSTPYPCGSRVVDGKLVKPWKLTREIPGFRPLRDGEEWHCGDSSWAESDLFEGERPVLVGEIPQIGDQVWAYGGGPWEEMTHPLHTGLGAGYTKHKTRRPLPEPAPEPAKVPLTPADWMKDGPWWVRGSEDDKCPAMVVSVNVHAVMYGWYSSSTYEEMMHCERSNDGINWTPCWKEGALS